MAVRVCAGDVNGATILPGNRGIYAARGVLNTLGKPVGTWRETAGAGWLMSTSSNANASALSFLVSGEAHPRKVIRADGTSECRRKDAGSDELPTLFEGHLANVTAWDPPPLAFGSATTTLIVLKGVSRGEDCGGGSAVECGCSEARCTAYGDSRGACC